LEWNAELNQIRENSESLPLQHRGIGVSRVSAVDHSRHQRLRHDGFVAHDPKVDPVAFYIESPMIESQESNHPDATSNALNADVFVFQIGGCWDRRPPQKGAF